MLTLTPGAEPSPPPPPGRPFDSGARFPATRTRDDVPDLDVDWICAAYTAPLYAHLRRRGDDPQFARDVVQDFLCGFLRHGYLARFDPNRGRLRSFLLTSLLHHRHKMLRKLRNEPSSGRASVPPIPIDEPDSIELPVELTSDDIDAFDTEAAHSIFRIARERVKSSVTHGGRGVLFEMLEPWLLRAAGPGDYQQIADRIGVTPGAVRVALSRLRTRLTAELRREVARSVTRPEDVRDELAQVVRLLIAKGPPPPAGTPAPGGTEPPPEPGA